MSDFEEMMHQHDGARRVGFTPVEAADFLHQEFPDVEHWTYVHTGPNPAHMGLDMMVGLGYRTEGQVGRWTWRRIPTRYPRFSVWNGTPTKRDVSGLWAGVIEVKGPEGEQFLVFSYLSHQDRFCNQYFFSTDDQKLILRFSREITSKLRPRRRSQIPIVVANGPDVFVGKTEDEKVFLPDKTSEDINGQVRSFFENKQLFRRIGARYQRGFLFVGPPGTGKTMTIRRLVRMCHRDYRIRFFSLNITRKTDADELGLVFRYAMRAAPSMIILEDMDSLTRESQVTRSALLSYMDGLQSNKGILIVGTSNNPENIDPALVHRPSRFDRIWRFPVPDADLRHRYLKHYYPDMEAEVIETLSRGTSNWSYAYMNELRTTAGILAVNAKCDGILANHLLEAHDLLAQQFDAGKKNYAADAPEGPLGFSN